MKHSLLWLSLCTSAAFAQTASLGTQDLSRGATLLPGSAALTDEPTSLVYNPAGLRHVQGPSLIYLHERSNSRSLDSDGVWAAATIADTVGVGASLESNRPNGASHRSKGALGLAFGSEALSAGATLNFLRGGALGSVTTVDVGVLSRPLRWLSFGAMARSLNAPSKNGLSVAREYTLGLGLRPLHERVSVGVDWVANEATPLTQSRMQYSVSATIVEGLRLSGGFSHSFSPATPLAAQLGLGIDFGHFGYTQGAAWVDGKLDWQFVARLSADSYGSVVPQRKIAIVNLADLGSAPGTTLGSLLGMASEDRYLRLLRFLERAADDEQLAAVVFKIEGAGLGLARADEVRQAIAHLRARGKKTFAYALSMGDAEYLMASACDQLSAAPGAMLQVDGVRSSVTFLGGAADKLGIDVDVARVGAYKSFPDQFTRSDMSDEQREAITAYLATVTKLMERRITDSRHLSAEAWQTIVNEGLKPVSRAKALHEIDEVFVATQLDEAVTAQVPGGAVAKNYRPFDTRDVRWGAQPTIAIIPVIGSISGGSNQNTPLSGGQVAGAASFIEALNEAVADDAVKAIVLRVDSGGGDALASDLMYRAVVEAKKKKTVIASMGDVAASGGYYVAMGAEQIFASPTTLTGSIGIFFVKPALKRLANSVGVNQESIDTGKLAGILDYVDPWTDEQRAAAQKWVDSGYDTFITEVAASRKLEKAKVDAIARGRVWSGADAQQRGLVDQLGGLMDAIAAAREKSHAPADAALVIWQSRATGLAGLLQAAAPGVMATPVSPPDSSPVLERLKSAVGQHAWLLERPALQARMEFTVDVN